ncbi:MAG: hypothetical protein NTV51_31785 [Verrucomicrobia bacterium]|nr:hypothetical protein [Verrucomicrobiota bacterium]
MFLRLVLRLAALVAFAATAAAQSTLVFTPPAGVAAQGRHVVLLSGDEEYRSEESLPMLAKILSQRHGFKTTVLFALDPDGTINPNNNKSLAGAEALDTADIVIMALRWRVWPDETMKHFDTAFRRGVPIIALRTSTHPFNFPAGSPWIHYTWNSKGPWIGGFGKHVLGETWVSHWGKHKFEATRGVIEAANASDPLLRGVTDLFGNADVYEAAPPADAKILVRGLVLKGMAPTDAPAEGTKKRADKVEQPLNNPAMPVAWTRLYQNESGKQNKIFTTTMGAATDLENEGLSRLIVNATYWAAGVTIPSKADVTLVDPYTPRMYGFDGYRTGLRPSDYALGKTVPVGGTIPPKAPKAAPATKTSSTSAPVSTPPTVTVAPQSPDRDLRSKLLALPANVVADSASKTPAALNTPLTLSPGDRIAIVGNTLADRMQHHNSLETLITQKFPQHNLTFRNLSAAGDEVVTRARSKDFGTPDEWLTKAQPSVVFAFFGYNESFAGPEGLPKFKQDLEDYLRNVRSKSYNGVAPPRIVLFSPIANEQLPGTEFAVPAKNNENLALYAAAMAEVAGDKTGVTFIDLFAPSQKLSAEAARQGRSLTINGIHLSESGDLALAPEVFKTLFGEAAPSLDTPAAKKLRALIAEKNEWWRSHYRTIDGYNVYGDRSKIAYVSEPDKPKITNTQIMMEEMAQRDTITANTERRVWAAAKGVAYNPSDDLPLPPVTPFGTNKPGPNPDGTYEHAHLHHRRQPHRPRGHRWRRQSRQVHPLPRRPERPHRFPVLQGRRPHHAGARRLVRPRHRWRRQGRLEGARPHGARLRRLPPHRQLARLRAGRRDPLQRRRVSPLAGRDRVRPRAQHRRRALPLRAAHRQIRDLRLLRLRQPPRPCLRLLGQRHHHRRHRQQHLLRPRVLRPDRLSQQAPPHEDDLGPPLASQRRQHDHDEHAFPGGVLGKLSQPERHRLPRHLPCETHRRRLRHQGGPAGRRGPVRRQKLPSHRHQHRARRRAVRDRLAQSPHRPPPEPSARYQPRPRSRSHLPHHL